jgi:hypothetical protein
MRDFFEPQRIVVGASSPAAGGTVAALCDALERPVVHCSSRSAELAKYAANALLATRIRTVRDGCNSLDGASLAAHGFGYLSGGRAPRRWEFVSAQLAVA